MSKQEWLRHAAEVGYKALSMTDRIQHASSCSSCKARLRTKRANRSRRERDDVMRSLGLVKTPYGWE